MHGVKLLRLMLGDFQHLYGKDAEALFLKLFDNVANPILGDGVRFHDGKSALQSFHIGRWSFVLSRFASLFLDTGN
jgi:hypothetical protein